MSRNLIIFTIAALFWGTVWALAETTPSKKYVLIIADWDGKPVPKNVISAVSKNPGIKLTFAWRSDEKISDEILLLEKEKKAELALSFAEEPLMPLVYDTEISSPVAIKYSWQEDVWNMAFRANEEFRLNTQGRAKGIYLRSGVFSGKLIDGLKKQGINWVNSCAENHGVFIKDDFLIIAAENKEFKSEAECWQWITASQQQFIAFVFKDKTRLTPEFISALSVSLRQSDNIKLVTPEIIFSKLKDKVPAADNKILEPDLSGWLVSPLVWYELSVARKAIEDYKNSGSADVGTLEKLKEELYKLYNYELISAMIKNPGKEDEELFQKEISNIYGLLKLPIDEKLKALPGAQQARQFSVDVTMRSLTVMNSVSDKPGKNINQFTVSITTNSITYCVELDTYVASAPVIVDIYMDLNNQEGAGLTNFLPGINGFVEPADAWEYALRIDKDKALLFRAGRFDSVQIKQIAVQIPWKVEIPRSLLRGNPLQWGYQAITATKRAEGLYSINDFLVKDNETRKKLLKENPLQIPAVRAQSHLQGKKD